MKTLLKYFDWLCQMTKSSPFQNISFGLLLLLLGQVTILAQTNPPTILPIVKSRIDTLQTPVNDELLYELEKDFVEILKSSKQAEKLLEAEVLLIATNDNTHWTNYSQATRILLVHRDLAAIPLLLRYIVIHSKRSAHHIMIPEYQRTLEVLSGTQFDEFYKAGPNLETRMRNQVQQIVNDWWRPNKESMVITPEKMQPEQLHVLVNQALESIRRNSDFSGAGGNRNSAYGTFHILYYRIPKSSSTEEPIFRPLHPAMLPLFLAKCGYRSNEIGEQAVDHEFFPYEFVIILAEYVQDGHADLIRKIMNDSSQDSTVRIVCALALVRASHEFPTDTIIELLAKESDLEQKLICLLSLRWAGPRAVPVLLRYMDNENLELATAAACALCDSKPKDAIPKFESLLRRQHIDAPILLLKALAEYKNPAARTLLKKLLTEAVEGGKNSQYLYRIIGAFVDAWGIEGTKYNADDNNYERQARLLLEIANEMEAKQLAESKRQRAVVESFQTQLDIAKEIEALRRREYKRLLNLQSDEIVSPKDSQSAYELLTASVAEVNTLQSRLMQEKSKLDATADDAIPK